MTKLLEKLRLIKKKNKKPGEGITPKGPSKVIVPKEYLEKFPYHEPFKTENIEYV